MNDISLKLELQWLCLQKGFEWNNIPSFSIITGINGAGKTHLINLLLSAPTSQRVSLVNSDSKESVKLILPVADNNQTIEGLISYINDKDNRLGQIAALKQNLLAQINYSKSVETKLINATDIGEKSNFKQQINQSKSIENNYIQQLSNLSIYSYEQELKKISIKLNKSIEDVTEDDIKEYANPIFNHLTEITDFKSFIEENETQKNKLRIKYSKIKAFDKINSLEDEQKIYEKINKLFIKFGFNYFVMKNPYGENDAWNGEVVFIGKLGEAVGYPKLSSGEQMIVKFVIWAMGKDIRGDRINTMLLDEPDAHLHPKMCKMMVDILQEISRPIEEGGSGIRIIMTTHSPSTVAFAPEGSLFVLESDAEGNRHMKHSTSKEAIHILSEGIFTFDKAIDSFKLIVNSTKKLIVCTEGKTDVLHINTAIHKLNRKLEVEVIDLHDAATLANFIKSTPSSLFGGKKLIAVFDNDKEGQDSYKSIKGDELNSYKRITATQCNGKSYACVLPLPNVSLGKYCPIEYLYSKDLLKTYDVLEKRNYQEYMSLFKGATPEIDTLTLQEFQNESSLRPFKVKDNIKNQFAEKVKEFTQDKFVNFIPLLDIFELILNVGDI